MRKFISVIISALMFSGCVGGNEMIEEMPTQTATETVDIVEMRVDEIVNGLSIDEKICQMLFVTPESITGVKAVTQAGEATEAALRKYPVGGIIYFAANINSREQVVNMINGAQSYSDIGLFIGVDEEGGRVARIGNKPQMETQTLPAMKNVKSREEAYKVGQTLARDISALGFNVDFAPVADVIVNEKNNEIGDRSFGSDPYWVKDMVFEVVRGLEEGNVSSVLKHFPGHGSTQANSHTGYSESKRTLAQLRECEFLPFKSGIEAGCDFVMVSHMSLVNAIEENVPASLSREVIEGLLKGEIGFEGIVITDSLSMGAITKEYDVYSAAVMAVKAGADMLLMPPDVDAAIEAVKNAVAVGEISNERIDESVRKIIRVKIEKGIMQ